jgi:hypothetical protein
LPDASLHRPQFVVLAVESSVVVLARLPFGKLRKHPM